ncbi:MAG: DUF1549 and DUF1553 domain-containing protein [Bryobacteraceae bacterium]|nr:DUF1549 and DUF1553 domain-containing protein [Bryobacteraceae bacterium]
MRNSVLFFSSLLLGQTPELERAHAPMIEPPVQKAKSVAEMTARYSPARAEKSAPVPHRNFIDEQIFGRMKKDGIPHAPLAGDEQFARRVWLDATGRIPPIGELAAFVADRDPKKRAKLIDQLTNSEAFIDKWAYYFSDLFRAGGRMGSGLNLFNYWLREWLKLDRPYNEVVTDLLTGAGKTSFSVPAGMYYARDFVKAKDDPEAPDAHDLVNQPDTVDEFTVTYSKVFLGLNLACISCHDGKNHLEKVNLFLTARKRDEFFGQAAFFGKTRQIMNWENGYQANTEYTVDDVGKEYDPKAESIVRVPRRGGDASPRFILNGERPKEGENYRDALARIMTSHPQFRRAFANRLWAELMGFGIVEPVDDFDLLKPDQPSNPALLDALANDFGKHNYSFKHYIRTIMNSSAYQLSSRFEGEWKESYAPYYARKYVRMLTAPEIHDAIALATGRPGKFSSGTEKVGMAMQMPEPKKADSEVQGFMKTFGQSNRDDMPKKVPPSSLQAMLLMQSHVVTDRVDATKPGLLKTLLDTVTDDRQVVDKIFQQTISRKPSPSEIDVALKAFAAGRQHGAENLQWALLNSPEFIFNY